MKCDNIRICTTSIAGDKKRATRFVSVEVRGEKRVSLWKSFPQQARGEEYDSGLYG